MSTISAFKWDCSIAHVFFRQEQFETCFKTPTPNVKGSSISEALLLDHIPPGGGESSAMWKNVTVWSGGRRRRAATGGLKEIICRTCASNKFALF